MERFAAKVFWISLPILMVSLVSCGGVLYSRITNAEIKAATVETSLGDIKERLERMENKIDKLKETE